MSATNHRLSVGYVIAIAVIIGSTTVAWFILGTVTRQRTHDRNRQLYRAVGDIWGGVHKQVAPTVSLAEVASLSDSERTCRRIYRQCGHTLLADKGQPLGEAQCLAAAEVPSNIPIFSCLQKIECESIPLCLVKAAAPTRKAGEKKRKQAKEGPPPSPYALSGIRKSKAKNVKEEKTCPGAKQVQLVPLSTEAKVKLDLQHRRKGLLWYSTYGIAFSGRYLFQNGSECDRQGTLEMPLPARHAAYDGFEVIVDGRAIPFHFGGNNNEKVVLAIALKAKEEKHVEFRFNSRGLDEWRYFFGNGTGRANNLKLQIETNFDEVDFPPGTLSPNAKKRTAKGWVLTWNFGNLLSGAHLAVAMPHKINPGPLASEISFFAPVSLVFFIGMILLVSLIKKVRLHPVHFAMLAASFFSFHLLFAYLVDHVSWWVAFAISSATSLGLVISYLRLIVGARFAILWAGGGQLFYLVLFSLAFCWKGYTGLTITVFSILSLFLLMQLTAHIDWFQRFAKEKPDPCPPVPAAYHEVG